MMRMKKTRRGGMVVAAMLLTPAIAGAHTFEQASAGFLSGLAHPLGGWDHVAAMIAVGLWAAYLGGKNPLRLTMSFLAAVAAGALLVNSAVALPVIEAGVMTSLLILGLLVALNVSAPTWAAGGLVALFGVFHGYAHASDIVGMTAAWAIVIGFMLSNGTLILTGLLAARSLERVGLYWVIRGSGAGIGFIGAALLLTA